MTKKHRWGKFAQQNTNLSGSANQRFWVTTSTCWFIVLQLSLDSRMRNAKQTALAKVSKRSISPASRKRLSDRTRFSASRVRSSCEAGSGSTRPCGNSFFTKFDYAKFDMCCKHQIQLRSLTMRCNGWCNTWPCTSSKSMSLYVTVYRYSTLYGDIVASQCNKAKTVCNSCEGWGPGSNSNLAFQGQQWIWCLSSWLSTAWTTWKTWNPQKHIHPSI